MGTKIIDKIVANDQRMRKMQDELLKPMVKNGRGFVLNIPRLAGKATLIKNLSKQMENKQIHRTFLTVEQLLELWDHRTDNRAGLVKLSKKFGCHMWTIRRKLSTLVEAINYATPIPESRYKAMLNAIQIINRRKINQHNANFLVKKVAGGGVRDSSFSIEIGHGHVTVENNRVIIDLRLK